MTNAVLDRNRYGEWAVIAGGSDGTGACFARDVAASGINVLLIARRPQPLEALADELRAQYDVTVRTLQLDLNSPDAVPKMVEATVDLEVGLYISNAGAGSGGRLFLDTPLTAINDVITRNVITVAAACHHFGNLMRARGRGGIVLMGSGAGLGGQPLVAAYSGAKAFTLNLAESLWSELRGSGVDVIGIAAPIMDTPTLRNTLGDMQIPGIFDAAAVARDSLRRLPDGCSYIYAFGEAPEESERQTALRRARVLAIEKVVAGLFSDS
jgi:short-subunit dehydrogenase